MAVANTTAAVIPAGGALIQYGQDYATETVSRTLAAIDVGVGAGKTQHAEGMIFAEFKGAIIKQVIALTVLRPNGTFKYSFLGTDAKIATVGFKITLVNGLSTLRLQDSATDATSLLAADDIVVATLVLGNS